MTRDDRDIAAFDARAGGYEAGWDLDQGPGVPGATGSATGLANATSPVNSAAAATPQNHTGVAAKTKTVKKKTTKKKSDSAKKKSDSTKKTSDSTSKSSDSTTKPTDPIKQQ